MYQPFMIFTIVSILLPILVHAQVDTIFASGGTCVYKIYPEYQKCMVAQQDRINADKTKLPVLYTREDLTRAVNKISCCAYWEFLACVERAAEGKCDQNRADMAAYTRQLGSAVPSDICLEEYPRYGDECDDGGGSPFGRLFFSSGSALRPSWAFSVFILVATLVGVAGGRWV